MAGGGEPTVRDLVLEELQAGNIITHADVGISLSLSSAQEQSWAGFGRIGLCVAFPRIDDLLARPLVDQGELRPAALICAVEDRAIYPFYVVWVRIKRSAGQDSLDE